MGNKLILLFLFFLAALPVRAATYYVSPSGSDTSAGTIAQPWKTLSKAASAVAAGDTVYLRGGKYKERSIWQKAGAEGAPITIRKYPGENPVIDGDYELPPQAPGTFMFWVQGPWYVIDGLEITEATASGAFISGGKHVTIKNSHIHHNWGGAIHLSGDNDLAENNLVHDNGLVNENNRSCTLGNCGWPATVTCARYPRDCTLRGNTVYDNWGEGISTFEALRTTIEDNVSYNNQQLFYLSDTKYSVFRKNIAYCTPGNPIDYYQTQDGLLVGDEKGIPISNGDIDPVNGIREWSSHNTVVNNFFTGCDRNLATSTDRASYNLYAHNTFVNSGGITGERANVLFYGTQIEGAKCTGCQFINNIILQENTLPIALGAGTASGWTFSHNLWSRNPGPRWFNPATDLIADPLLTKTGMAGPGQLTAAYFRITPGSPAIDRALPLPAVTDDFFNTVRTAYPDIGGHEYITKTGDADGDGDADTADFKIWKMDYGKPDSQADFDINGITDGKDYVIWVNAYGK